MLKIRGVESNDYFQILCEECNEPTENEYLGGPVPSFKATCKKCNQSDEWKLDAAYWEGLPFKAL